MKLKRKATAETVTLSDGFLWSDEFDWDAVEQEQRYAVNGALIIQEGTKQAGRPITLTAEKDMAWTKRHIASTLKTWASHAGEQFELEFEYVHDTRRFNVIFNHASKAIEAKPVKNFPSVSDDEYYNVTLRFTEVPNDDD